MGMNWQDDVMQNRYGLCDPWDYNTQSIMPNVMVDIVHNKSLPKWLDNPFAICEETFSAFFFLANELQRFLRGDCGLPLSEDRQIMYYINLSKVIVRSVHTVGVQIVSYFDSNGNLEKGHFEKWLDRCDVTPMDRLKRLYGWLVGYLSNPIEFEPLFTKKYV